ncbi:MAG: DUF3999 domain-containing protein [Gammaproteobacteria bacterium]|nr:MAG: DUF3999 domain-containing protein [Gammaproteobacteria bacterium]
MKRLLTLLMLLPLGSLATAPEPVLEARPTDFRWGFPVIPAHSRAGIYEIELTGAVLGSCAHPDLGDLRLFGEHDNPVPFIIVEGNTATAAPSESWREVPHFPLYRAQGRPPAQTPEIYIDAGPDGTIVNIRGRDQRAAEKAVWAYLIDLGEGGRGGTALRLRWKEKTDNALVRLIVEQSDDLIHWRPALESAVLAHLHFGGQRIDRDTLLLPTGTHRYLRLRGPGGDPGFELLQASMRQTVDLPPRPPHWVEPAATERRVDRSVGIRYFYDGGAPLPVSQLQIRMPRDNSLARVTLHSRPDPGSRWRLRWQGVSYRLRINGETLENPAIPLSRTRDRYWRLTVNESSGAAGHPPTFLLGWYPPRVRFLGEGDSRYLLTCGNRDIRGLPASFTGILRQHLEQVRPEMLGATTLGERQALGSATLTQPPAPPLPWRQWLLWAVLLAGVLVVGLMVRNLWREMQSKR